jgi:uncharacterized protein (TIGR02145 family)
LKSKNGWRTNGYHNGTNKYGFSGLPGGIRTPNESFQNIREGGFWWSSTEIGSSLAWSLFLTYDKGEINIYRYNTKSSGLSVRCIKD